MSVVCDAPTMGAQRPRVLWLPDDGSPSGSEAIDLARSVGLNLDEWQAYLLDQSLAERPDGKWAAREVGLVIPRQNGKGGLLEARELAGLFLLDEELIIHSAHEFSTSLEAFHRLLAHIQRTPWMEKRVSRISRSHGDEGIDLKSGQRIRFRTRTSGGGRGFSADVVVLDEAMILPTSFHGALMPVVSARENPQIWYTGSAVDQADNQHGEVLARVRDRGTKGTDPTLLYAEWSAHRGDGDTPYTPDDVTGAVLSDHEAWAEANPAYGIRISQNAIESELRSMTPRKFCVERLGIGDWPKITDEAPSKVDLARYRALADHASAIKGSVFLAIDTSPDRAWSSIAAAGTRADGLRHVEIVERRRGVGWVPDRLAEIVGKSSVRAVILDAAGPAGSLLPDLESESLGLGVPVVAASAKDYARACGQFYDLVQDGGFRHRGQAELDAAVKGAKTRTLGDAWVWHRTTSHVDITPLVSATLALYGPSIAPEEEQNSWRPL